MLFIKGHRKTGNPPKSAIWCGFCGLFAEIAGDTWKRNANFMIKWLNFPV